MRQNKVMSFVSILFSATWLGMSLQIYRVLRYEIIFSNRTYFVKGKN